VNSRQIEITVERETVSVLYPTGQPNDQRCPCCGQEISKPQQLCPAHDRTGDVPDSAVSTNLLSDLISDSSDEVKE